MDCPKVFADGHGWVFEFNGKDGPPLAGGVIFPGAKGTFFVEPLDVLLISPQRRTESQLRAAVAPLGDLKVRSVESVWHAIAAGLKQPPQMIICDLRVCDHDFDALWDALGSTVMIIVVEFQLSDHFIRLPHHRGVTYVLGETAMAELPRRIKFKCKYTSHLFPDPTWPDLSLGNVLVGEGDGLIRSFLFDILYEIGFGVTICGDDRQLLEAFTSFWKGIDIVLIPRRLGASRAYQLLTQLERIDPKVRAIVVSSRVDRRLEEKLRATDSIGFLQMPFSVYDLTNQITYALGREVRPVPWQECFA